MMVTMTATGNAREAADMILEKPALAPEPLEFFRRDQATRSTELRVAEGVRLARDLVNTPSNDMGPDELEAAARELAGRHAAGVGGVHVFHRARPIGVHRPQRIREVNSEVEQLGLVPLLQVAVGAGAPQADLLFLDPGLPDALLPNELEPTVVAMIEAGIADIKRAQEAACA